MLHCILTRAHYHDCSLDYSRRRLELTRRYCIPSLVGQTCPNFLWIVRADLRDPLLEERKKVILQSGLQAFVPTSGGWWKNVANLLQDETHVLTTRLDDDDALAVDFVERLQSAVQLKEAPEALDFPHGFRLDNKTGRYEPLSDSSNQFISLYAPVSREMTAFSIQHTRMGELAPVRVVDNRPAWLWVRHDDSLSQYQKAPCQKPVQEINHLFSLEKR